jgi:hypothetical protein
MDRRAPARLPRAIVFTAMCVTLSAAAHAVMSAAIPWWALGLAVLLVLPVAYRVARNECGFARIAACMLAGELALHELFGWAQVVGGTHATAAGTGTGAGGMSGSAPMPMPMPGSMSVSGSMSMPMPGPARSGAMPGMSAGASLLMGHGPWRMLAAHVLAGLACSWWLRQGEAAVFALVRAAAHRVLTSLRLLVAPIAVVLARPRVAVRDRAARTTPYPATLTHVLVRRGPPPSFARS